LIERSVLLAESATIDVDDLHLRTKRKSQEMPLMTLEEAELKLLKMAMAKTDNNAPKAAQLLGLTKSSMYRRLEKHNLAY
jgi:transcriptional regulator of acetoin/glycerol metabolism